MREGLRVGLRTAARRSVKRVLPEERLWRALRINAYFVGGERNNFGDYLTPVLLDEIFGLEAKRAPLSHCDMIGVGSILEQVEAAPRLRKPYVWGTGFITAGPDYTGRPVRVLAVRGEESLRRLRQHVNGDVVLGDPGLLAPCAYPDLRTTPKVHDLGVIPHLTDGDHPVVGQLAAQPGVHVIEVRDHPRSVAQQIAQCRNVVSSSLHGLVVADALGVPNAWLPLGSGVIGGDYKFRDYYSAFGITPDPVSGAEAEALVDAVRARWEPREGLAAIQRGLIEVFPAKDAGRARRSPAHVQ